MINVEVIILLNDDKLIIEEFISFKNHFRKFIQIDKVGIHKDINKEVTLSFILNQYLQKPWISLFIWDTSDVLKKYFSSTNPSFLPDVDTEIKDSLLKHSVVIRENSHDDIDSQFQSLIGFSAGHVMKYFFNGHPLNDVDVKPLLFHALRHPEQYISSTLIEDLDKLFDSFDDKIKS